MFETISIEKAMLYEQYRLPYPGEMVDDFLRLTGHAEIVADIGAGTGQLARLFAKNCNTVYAVEPDSSMRKVAIEAVKDYPNITIIDAFAEQTTLPANTIDLIVVGNAFHRFKGDAITELLRILKKSGWIAVISYTFTDRSFSEMLFSRLGELPGLAARESKTWHRTPIENLFEDNPIHTLNYTQSANEDWEAFWGAARSGIEAPEPGDADFARFKEINQEVFDTFSVDGHIRIDYETGVIFGQPAL
ncbi:MAG TPA: class I SAM-dependent methyltransferase [Aggregatilineales bacterium]|nr:class I SAM-dependent methyltransferase [Aggregatilineales bacterium]